MIEHIQTINCLSAFDHFMGLAVKGLSNRYQYVFTNGFNSNHKLMKYGLPQGSVFGTLLFLIFLNDLNYPIKNSTTVQFSDDTYLLSVKQSIKEINISVNKDLKSLRHWLNANKISLNVTKTEAVIFRAKGQVFDTDHFVGLALKGLIFELVTFKSSVKYSPSSRK